MFSCGRAFAVCCIGILGTLEELEYAPNSTAISPIAASGQIT
jgi:hypothetical protein